MKIAQIAPLAEKVPPDKYGGTERVVYNLVEELVKMGHDVTLFASGDSKTSAKLVSVYPKALRYSDVKDIYGFNTYSILNTGLAYSMQDQFDVIHDHNPHMGLSIANIAKTPAVMTWHGPYTPEIIQLFSTLNKPYVVSISNSQARFAPSINFAGTVYNGLAMDSYPFSDKDGGYLLFVGRISMEKGVHFAIDAAVALSIPLIIAAKLDNVRHDQEYFSRFIKPRLKKHSNLVKWIGEVNEEERNRLMAKARAFLHPATWPEPFGLTLIESMACGCPVVGFNKGSIPELVIDGETGFVVEDLKQMVAAIASIDKINRANCRKHALANFSSRRMAQDYLEIYKRVIAKSRRQVEKVTKEDKFAIKPGVEQYLKDRKSKKESLIYEQRVDLQPLKLQDD